MPSMSIHLEGFFLVISTQFPVRTANIHSHQQFIKFPFSTSLTPFISCLLYKSHSNWDEMIPHGGFDFYDSYD